jgi:hypothetical protein
MPAKARKRRRIAGVMAVAIGALATVPATASAAGLIAAYERYENGKGFELGLVNVSTGAALTLPAGVNTADDELHPALTPDGRYLIFMRTRLLPKLNGDIVPPPERSLHVLDRQTGAVTPLTTLGKGAGPNVFLQGSTTFLGLGVEPTPCCTFADGSVFQFALGAASLDGAVAGGLSRDSVELEAVPAGQRLEVTHGVAGVRFPPTGSSASLRGRYLGLAFVDPNSGALQKGQAHISTSSSTTDPLVFGGPGTPASHPVPRAGDNYVALDLANGEDADIQTLSFPGETALTPAPPAINTAAAERMPAWSPDSLRLGFVRTTAGRRSVGLFDATPGIQTVVNPVLDIGPEAPSPQTRAYQSTWGGLSLADAGPAEVPAVTCSGSCTATLAGSTAGKVVLKPRVSLTSPLQRIGIFVVRVTGKRKLLGRTVPRIRAVGRVPLGKTRKGLNRYRWNGKVEGRRLKPGTYLLTYRALLRDRVVNTSNSIRFKIDRSGAIGKVRALR